jgi:hypothetical protein
LETKIVARLLDQGMAAIGQQAHRVVHRLARQQGAQCGVSLHQQDRTCYPAQQLIHIQLAQELGCAPLGVEF